MKERFSKLIISLFCIHILFASMLPNVDALDIVKLPNLLNHFYYHHQKDSKIDFIEFVNLHYGSKSYQHNKEENHGSLPFQLFHSFDSTTQYISFKFDNLDIKLSISTITFFNFYNQSHESNYSASIWQPPKSTI